MLPPHCEPQGAFLTAVSSAFGTCIPSAISLVSTVFGTLSMMSWLCAQIPQVHKNYLNQSVKGLSWAFMAIWLAGDICNFTGAVLLQQQPFQIAIAAYYVLIDTVLVFQLYYYGFGSERLDRRAPLIKKSESEVGGDNTRTPSLYSYGTNQNPKLDGSRDRVARTHRDNRSFPTIVFGSLALLSSRAHAAPIGTQTPLAGIDIGQVLSWTSCILYFSSRIPQILKNHSRKSTDGLSPILFMAAFSGNFFYSTSLIINPLGWNDYPAYGGGGLAGPDGSVADEWWSRTLPFFLGAWSVVIMDAIVGLQFYRWPPKKDELEVVGAQVEGEGQGLLSEIESSYNDTGTG
ncbi:PQ loop repeat-domain-containing protein [Tuber brumale]|nr:PQ loop repeat-domain-containing protein [Tuber brumale]